MGVTLDLSD